MQVFNDLIAGIGNILGIDGLAPDAEGFVEIASQEATIVLMCSDATENILFMTAKIMDSQDAAANAMRRALEESFGTDCSVSIDPEDGAFHLSDFVPIRLLTPDSLVAKLGTFASALLRLRTLLASGDSDSQGPADVQSALPFNPFSDFLSLKV